MFSIFTFNSYSEYLQQWIKRQPRRGHGEVNRISAFLKVNPTLISQVLNQRKELSLDQAHRLTRFLGLDDVETDFFQALVQRTRAGTFEHKQYWENKLADIRKQSGDLRSRVHADRELSDVEKAIYYGTYLYSAIRIFCSLKSVARADQNQAEGKTLTDIVDYFKISREAALNYTQLLLSCRLLEKKDDRYLNTEKMVFIGRDSPFLVKHLLNWRLQTLKQIESTTSEEMCITFPVSISKADFSRIREELIKTIQATQKIVNESSPEEIAYLNIDFLKLT